MTAASIQPLHRYSSGDAPFQFTSQHRAVTAAIMVALLHPCVFAAANTDASTPDLEEVMVIGKAVPGAVIGHIPAENHLNPEDIAAYGVSSISDLLNEIAEQTQSDQGRDNTAGPIILVNGKRVSGINEIGDLPTESILRVDILPEEVALKYGYNAQQKVVNIILRRDFQANVINLGTGVSTAGHGENGSAAISYTRIQDNDRINVVARVRAQAALLESDRDVSSTAGTGDPTGAIGNDSDARTLKPATRMYSLNGVLAHTLSDTFTAAFNAQASYQTSRALDGFPSAELEVPASSPYAQSSAYAVIDRYLSDEVLHQDIDTAKAHAGITVNADLPVAWRLSMIGAYDYSDERTRTDRGYDVNALQEAINAGDVDPYGLLSKTALGSLRYQNATAITNTGSASALLNGTLLRLPAGNLTTSINVGGDFSSFDSSSTAQQSKTTSRSRTNGQISIDLPLTSRSNDVLKAIGDLSANLTGAITNVSGYGSLGTFGYGLHWMPRTDMSFIASINEDRQAPTLAQLNGPEVTTSNVRVYDYVQGTTVTINQISGGNPDLQADDRRVFKLGAALAPLNTDSVKLNVTANYLRSLTRNLIGSLGTATALTEQAFPDRFERNGTLLSVDTRAVNFAREAREEVRWGFNLTKVLRAPTKPNRNRAGSNTARESREEAFGAAMEGFHGGGARTGGFGANTGGFAGEPGRGGRDVPGGDFAGGNGAQLQVSLYHSWYFVNKVRLNANGPTIDLLDGGTIASTRQARHKLQLNTGVIDNGLGLRFNGNWTAPTTISDQGDGSGALYYASLTTLDLRLFADLQQRFANKAWARGTRVTLAVSNVFDTHQQVNDATGATPEIYQPAFLDPSGRFASISFRRLF